MRPNARRLAHHGGAPGWLEERDPAGVILYVIDGLYSLPFPYLTGCPYRSCPAAVIYKCTQPSVMSYVTQGRNGLHSSRHQCLLFRGTDMYVQYGFLYLILTWPKLTVYMIPHWILPVLELLNNLRS